MLLKILRFFFGYAKVEVYGFAPERFMNLMIQNEIVVWDVAYTDRGYTFFTGRYNLLKMKPYLQKTNMKLKLVDKFGLPYLIKKNKKRVAFLFGFCFFIIALYMLSLFVWEVRIVGEDKLVKENMLEYIEEHYVPLGTMKKNVHCGDLEEELRVIYPDISWISCELKGTSLTVYLEEGMAPQNKTKTCENGDIIAAKDAKITKMITREGTPVAKVDEQVKKGDILISGTIYIYDDNNEVLETNYIAADGDVHGLTTYQYEDYVDLQYYKKKYNEQKKTYISFYVFDYCVTPFTPKKPKENFDTYREIHKAKIFSNFYLPFGYTTTEWRSYTLEKKKYSNEEANKLLKQRLDKKIAEFKEKGVEIIKNDVTIERDGNRFVAKGTLTLNEPIASFKKGSTNLLHEQEID